MGRQSQFVTNGKEARGGEWGDWVLPSKGAVFSDLSMQAPERNQSSSEGEGDAEKKENAEGSSDEEGKLVIDEPVKDKDKLEKTGSKRKSVTPTK
eukprot:g17340.t1